MTRRNERGVSTACAPGAVCGMRGVSTACAPGAVYGMRGPGAACAMRGMGAPHVAQSGASGVAKAGQRGVALLLALLTMVLLTIVVVEFTFSTQVEYRRAQGWLAARRAALIAQAGVDLAGEVLAQDFRISNTDNLTEMWATELAPIDTGNGQLVVRIEDEQGRFNVNRLSAGAASVEARRMQTLLAALQLDTALVAPLADWIDRNQEALSAAGAEDAYYTTLKPPYTARNAPLLSFAELALVRGFTPAILARLRPVATVLPDTAFKVNVNTAPPAVLQALDARLDQFLIQRIVERRKTSPFTSIASLRALDGMQVFSESDLDRLFTFSSNYFRVRSTGESGGVLQSAEALLYRVDVRIQVLYVLTRRGPNIVGADLSAPVPITDAARFGATRL